MNNALSEKDVKFQRGLINLAIVIAFAVIAIVFFMNTIYWGEYKKFEYPRYLPGNKWFGGDFLTDYQFAARYFQEGKSAYITEDPAHWYTGNPYPPGFTFTLAPLFWFNITKETGYKIVFWVILGAYFILTLFLPMIYLKRFRITSANLFIIVTGLLSYGMQFALERGQFDLLAMLFGIGSVYVFWFFPKYRWLAYLMLIIAFQYKIYPMYLAICFIDDLKHPAKSIIRLLGLVAMCYASLFLMGIQGYQEFMRSLTTQTTLDGYNKDHSILSGSSYILHILNRPINLPSIVLFALPIVILIGFTFILLGINYLRKYPQIGFYPPLILWCTLAGMVLFPASKDYKLVILFAAMAIYVTYIDNIQETRSINKPLVFISGLFLQMLGYCATLFSYAYKPYILQDNLPFLVLIMVSLPLSEWCISGENNTTNRVEAIK
jgi:hypothetical protein